MGHLGQMGHIPLQIFHLRMKVEHILAEPAIIGNFRGNGLLTYSLSLDLDLDLA